MTDSKKVRISVIKADLSPDREVFTKQHICCLVSFRGEHYKTLSHQFCGNNPVWEEEFSICMGEDSNILEFKLYTETTSDSLIATGSADLGDIEKKKWIDLEKNGKFIGKLLVECFNDDLNPTALKKNTSIKDLSPEKKRDWMETNTDDTLRDYMRYPGFVEARQEGEIKIAGIKNSTSEYTDHPEKKSVLSTVKDFVDNLIHHHKDEAPKTKKEFKEIPSRSLSDFMDKPMCVERSFDKQTKIAGTKNSWATKAEPCQKEVTSDELGGMLDKAGFKESREEDSTKISGTYNTPAHVDEKEEAFFVKDKATNSKFEKSNFDSKAAHAMGGMLDEESFEKATYQEGLKLGGTKNC